MWLLIEADDDYSPNLVVGYFTSKEKAIQYIEDRKIQYDYDLIEICNLDIK